MLRKELHNENRLAWNEATKAHNSHKKDQTAFFKEGGQTLFPEEKQLLGDIAGLSVVHLQCNAGQDTLSLAQMGAIVTGIDISDTAIEFARNLAADSGIPATFIQKEGRIADIILETQSQQDCNFIFMGGYSKPPVIDIVLSSPLDQVLRESSVPVLICR